MNYLLFAGLRIPIAKQCCPQETISQNYSIFPFQGQACKPFPRNQHCSCWIRCRPPRRPLRIPVSFHHGRGQSAICSQMTASNMLIMLVCQLRNCSYCQRLKINVVKRFRLIKITGAAAGTTPALISVAVRSWILSIVNEIKNCLRHDPAHLAVGASARQATRFPLRVVPRSRSGNTSRSSPDSLPEKLAT